ncbi:MAG: alpha-L-fucosidase [Thermoguttaceae bacterium]
MRRATILAAALGVSLAGGLRGEEATKEAKEAWDMLTAKPEVVAEWQDLRFGMFNCWGPVSLTGLEIGWSRGAPRGGEFRVRQGQGPTPVEIYDNLYKKWKPDQFDARQWVALAQEAGMKYMIFLVKHHDGFCLYDTKLTDYRSTGPESAWKVDLMKEVADACHAADLKLIVYYSQPDWHHPDYRSKTHARYIEYLHGQVRELLTNYGRIDGFWFDLGGKPEDWDTPRLFKMMRTLQPWLIINNRCGLPGDFDTPEQRLGSFELERPWETCMTLGTQWSWKPDDKLKSLKECIDVLVTCAGRNGNLALNTGPMPDGRIEPRQTEVFRGIGRWLKEYGDSIYGTRGGPFWGLGCLTTRKEDTIYVHVLKWYDDRVTLPSLGRRIVSHEVLTGGRADVRQTEETVEIAVPAENRSELDTIIALHLDGSAMDLAVAPITSGQLTFGKRVTVSHIYDADPDTAQRYKPEFAIDGDPQSGWTFNRDQPTAWLEVDLGAECTFDRAWLNEPYGRIRQFELQAEQEGQWVTFHRGTTMGENCQLEFEPVTARRVRLVVQKTTINPLVGEFQLFSAK